MSQANIGVNTRIRVERAEFLQTYQLYQLGELVTESTHPDTRGLSTVVKKDLGQAFEILKNVDLKALQNFRKYDQSIEKLRQACQETLEQKGRIFLCGCGATGRLSLTIEYLWREKYKNDQVISFMAGGDIALVHSLEGFEDYPQYGARHLKELGFTENDLLIGTTEGGETPYVIGAVEEASRISKHKPFMLYCNSDELLRNKVERSKRVIDNPDIETHSLFVGPMALSGSTRMQASTVLQLALGLALIETNRSVSDLMDQFYKEIENLNFQKMKELTQKEAALYKNNEYVMYMPRQMAITVFTDTTERSPTFNLPPFESHDYQGIRPSLCYILIPDANDADQAWHKLLFHEPRPLNWQEIEEQTTSEYLKSFDFSKNSLEKREERLGEVRQYLFEIDMKDNKLLMSLAGVETSFSLSCHETLFQHTALKMLLNAHSTLLMGLMGRYQSNVMTWVTATNGKLIDRATRYIQLLLKEKNFETKYLDIVNRVFDAKNSLGAEECVVLKVVEGFEKTQNSGVTDEHTRA